MQPDPATAAPTERFARGVRTFSQRHWRVILFLMLLFLHVATARGVGDAWARGMLLAHLGLLLLWQPFMRGDQPISIGQAGAIGLLAVLVMLRLDWWMLAAWIVVLAGLVGGKVYQQQLRWQRWTYLAVFVYLLALLTVIVLPEIAPKREITREVREIAEYALPVLFASILFLPAEQETADAPQLIDFFYSLFLILLIGVTVLGSFTVMTLGERPYLEALTYTVFLIAGGVLLIGFAWSPRRGFAGLDVFVSRYLLSIGLPLERWLYLLAGLSQTQSRPDRFLAEGVAALAGLPWVAGAQWRTSVGAGEYGARTPNAVTFRKDALELVVYSRYRMSPALQWHLHLLGQLLGEFYVAKLREQELQHSAYLHAVHETGARMTHEVKNLLQSLRVLAAVGGETGAEGSQRGEAFVRRELPRLAERLSETLEKLRRPLPEPEREILASAWWQTLRERYPNPGIRFVGEGPFAGTLLPLTLFDGVADNLLQNALSKRAADPGVRIEVRLSDGTAPSLSVCDSGRVIPPEIAATLLREPVRSGSGMGIGLYQAARQAEARGYRLALTDNRDGEVRFTLARAEARRD